MRILITLFFCCALFFGCKTNRYADKEREGLWIEKSSVNGIPYKSKGRYHKGFEKKTWRYYEDGKLITKEKYRDSICYVTHYKNGKKNREGQTKLLITETDLHWFYFGDWKTYDATGKLTEIDTYVNGELLQTVEFAPE